MKKEKVVLAFSGGLDTSFCVKYLSEEKGYEVHTAIANTGGFSPAELKVIEQKALALGAASHVTLDIEQEYYEKSIKYMVFGNILRNGTYPISVSSERIFQAIAIIEYAKKIGADYVAHGSTGAGNDQVRFELTIKALAPEMQIIAPWRIWNIKSREQEIEYAEAHNVPIKITRETNYSKDMNLWHLSHEGLDLEDPANEPQYNKPGFLELGVSPEQAPDKPTYVTIHFEKGIPTALNGEKMDGVKLIKALNKLGGENGIGIYDVVENRLVGMKSRGVYETPGGTILYHAHEVLETICLDKETQHYKAGLAQKYADIVYNGQWYTPLREAMDAFVDKTQETVNGDVKLKLYKGNIINAGVTSPDTLYSRDFASFDEDDVYDQKDAAGFINLFGLPIHVKALLDAERNKK